MTTVVLSPPSGPASSPATVPSGSKSVLMSVAVDTAAAQEAKEPPASDSDSPTSTAIDLGLNQVDDVNVDVEPAEEDTENVEWRANGVADESAVATGEQRPNKKRRRVSFECADIVEFEPTVYTTSVTSGGVPIGLSLNERSRSRRRLDSFEMERANDRVGRQNYMEEGYLDPQEREIILNNAGCDEPVIASVEAEVNAIIQNRRESNEIDVDFMYGSSEMEDYEDEVEEEEAEESNVLSYDGVGDELPEESEEEQEDIVEEDAAAMQHVASASTSDEGSVEQEELPASSETTQAKRPASSDAPPVQDLTPGSQGHNLVLQVVSIAPTVEKKRYDGTISRIAEAVLADETDASRSLRETIDMLKEGLVVVVRNSNADIFNGFMRLNVTQWGKLSLHPDGVASTPPPPPSVNTENNISAVEYELVTVDDADE
ncbi:Nucleic acid-binding, OB-fold [Phytophthora cactorum]|nr:Nucleic acid-binding, OB-fold [Phytophthora cactorum]